MTVYENSLSFSGNGENLVKKKIIVVPHRTHQLGLTLDRAHISFIFKVKFGGTNGP